MAGGVSSKHLCAFKLEIWVKKTKNLHGSKEPLILFP